MSGIEEKISLIFPEEEDIPEEICLKKPIIQSEYLINGEIIPWQKELHDVFSPICIKTFAGLKQKVIGSYPVLTEKESLQILDAAVNAYNNGRGPWPSMSVSKRIKYIEDFAFRLEKKKRDIVKLLMWEIGKSYKDSEKEFERTIRYIKNIVNALKTIEPASSKFLTKQEIISRMRRAPLGVVLCMSPFNYPIFESFATLIPALITGNTVVFKPPKPGVLVYYPLLEIFRDTFPPGVVNTVYGEGRNVITPIISSGKIDVLSFTGSSRVANILKSQHPKPLRLSLVLGLDAKNAAIVLSDADMDLTVKETIRGSLSFNGQRCTALKILFVHSKVIDLFIERFVKEVEKLICGMPWEEDVMITPLPDPDKPNYLSELIDDAVRLGAKVINKNGGLTNKTFFYPAVIYPVSSPMRLYNEEQFGPVVPVSSFDDLELPIQYIIGSNYGQQVSIFGNDIKMLAKLVDILACQVCRININSICQRGPDFLPFAGRKDSGVGTMSIMDSLCLFSMRAIVTAKNTEPNKTLLSKIM